MNSAVQNIEKEMGETDGKTVYRIYQRLRIMCGVWGLGSSPWEGKVHVKIYRAGKDFDYIPKYGAVTKSMLVINEKKAITKLTKPAVRAAFKEALEL